MISNESAIRSGVSIDDREHGDVAADLEEPVAVRGVVAVEAPDAAQAGGAGGVRLARSRRIDLEVQRTAVVRSRPARCGSSASARSRGRARRFPAARAGVASSSPSRLQTRTRSSVMQRLVQQPAELGQDPAIVSPAPTATTIIGTSALRPKNCARARRPRLVPSTPSRTRGAGDAAAVEQVADRDERGHAGRRAPGGRRRR